MRKNWKIRPTCLADAVELCAAWALEKHRRPAKVLADLMGVELKTYYRWLSEDSMPLNRVRQFEEFCGASFISEYLCIADGRRVVVAVPVGRKTKEENIAEIQAQFSEAITLLIRFYRDGVAMGDTVNALSLTLAHVAYQRENVMKASTPELEMFGGSAA